MRPSIAAVSLIAAAAAIASGLYLARRRKAGSYGSLTSASDAVDDIELRPDASPEEVVDVGVMETFPASDPPAVQEAFKRRNSPDWLLRRS